MSAPSFEAQRQRFEAAGQSQVFRFADQLNEAQKADLATQAAAIDLSEIDRLVGELDGGSAVDLSGLEPAPYVPLPENGGDADRWAEARAAGEEALRAGQVACFTVAGGQGTRLGYDGPKGTFPVTPIRQAPLFQVFAEKVWAASERYGVTIPWLIQTSPINHAATVAFFEENGNFGLAEGQVRFLTQGTMPAVSADGKILLESPGQIALSPDGHGGSLRALVRSGAVDTLQKEGVTTLSYFQVDNPLVRGIDPAFIGFHRLSGSEMSSKMIPKAYAAEKVGHFCVQNEKTVVIEYSDLPAELQEETTADGTLRFLAGSIAIHILDVDFVARIGSGDNPDFRLPFHQAHKKIAVVDDTGATVKPETPNGVKFELFIFDAIPFAQSPLIIETDRAEEFSPVKNAEGLDSPETCRQDQLRQWARWLAASGVTVPLGEDGVPAFNFEITPRYADATESLAERLAGGPVEVEEGTVLDA